MLRPWLTVLTQFHRVPIFSRISLTVLALGGYALLVEALDQAHLLPQWVNLHASLHGLLGLVLGMLLVFRTNTAYDRWWEGRKLWGQLTNDSRNLAIKVQTCVAAPEAEKRNFVGRLVAFAFALKDHLRGGARLQDVPGMASAEADPTHVPVWLAQSLYEQIHHWRRHEQLDGFEMLFLDQHARGLLDVCGGCERIRKTKLARSYRWFCRQLISLYLLTLPWGLIEDFEWWTIPTVVLIGYFMIGIETIAADIEEPFGTDADDLKLDEMCRSIQVSLSEIVGLPHPHPADSVHSELSHG